MRNAAKRVADGPRARVRRAMLVKSTNGIGSGSVQEKA